MPWSNQGGGGPWGSGPKGPWGSGSPPPGSSPPDLEDLLRRGQDKLRNVLPGGGLGGTGLLIIALIAAILWLSSGLFQVKPDELGLVMRFGKFDGRPRGPGLGYHLPYPIETVEIPKVTRVTPIQVGVRFVEDARRGTQTRDMPEESLMLTGDVNIVDVNFTIFWVVAAGATGASDFLFNMQNPEGTVKAVAESAMREVIGRSELDPILTVGRQRIEAEVHELVQKTLDQYKAGIAVTQVQMLKVEVPTQVIEAFRDVQTAQADQERVQNEARTYASQVVPQARGRAAQLLQSAEACREQTVAEATGQTARFNKIYDEYKKAPDVTRQRLYLETMERLFGGTDKVILDSSGQASGVVPYLPLPELRSRPPAQQPPSTTGGNR